MSNLAAYRGVLESLWRTPTFKRYLQIMEGEPDDTARLSGIEEWRKQTITRLKETLEPAGRAGDLKTYRDNLAFKKATSEFNEAQRK
jgi:hypothetical protein